MTGNAELAFEVTPAEDTRSPVRGRAPRPWRATLLLLPGAALVGGVLVVPLLATAVASIRVGEADLGVGHYRSVLGDSGVRHAVGNSLLWLALAVLVCLVGLLVAWLGLRARYRLPALLVAVVAAPVAVSPLVVGIVFRLLFDPSPERGTVNAILGPATDGQGIAFLGPGWIGLVLALAFSWQWIGLAVIVFQVGLLGVPAATLRTARAFGVGRLRRLWTVVAPAVFPLAALALLIVLVAAARVFDLVLVTAPGSIQDDVEVAGLHWWRSGSDLGGGGAAALGILMFVVVGLAALAVLWGLSQVWPGDRSRRFAAGPLPPAPGSRPARLLGVLAAALWALPPFVLLATSLRTPRDAAGSGWWSGGWSLDSYASAFASGELLGAVTDTGGRAVLAVVLLLVVSVPAAYALAWGGLPRTVVRGLVAVLAVLAVMPMQTVAVPLGEVFDQLRLLGASGALSVVHAAIGVPLAILLLRNAFGSVPREVVRTRRLEPEPASALVAVVSRRWRTVLTVAVLEFVLVWNDLFVGLLLGGPDAGQVALVLLGEARQFATSTGVLAAGAVVSLAVPLAVVLATGRWLVRGLTEGVAR